MLGSPAKRRRTSPTTFVPIADQDVNRATTSNPSTPRRASYLSPTKASLARSHPKILSQTRRKRILDSTKGTLRDEVLGHSKKAAEPTMRIDDNLLNNNDNNTRTASLNFADIVRNTFNTTEESNRDIRRSPLRARQPSIDQNQTNADDNGSSAIIVPKLVSKDARKPRAISERRSTDPELPPTPVQLGIDQPPERPRGLASSSSPGGSGRRRIRLRNGQVTSSPLKPKEVAPIHPSVAAVDVEIASGIGDEIESESYVRPGQNNNDNEIITRTAHLREKQESLRKLTGELDQMKKEMAKLKSLSNLVETDIGNHASELDEVINMLQASNSDKGQTSPNVDSVSVSAENLSFYLRLFAPGNLRLSHMTWTKQVRQRAKLVHQITIAPPAPWPINALAFTFDVVIDVAEARMENITNLNSEVDTTGFGASGPLHQWMVNRLSQPLYNRDLATLIWGAGRYFDESVKRAKTFKVLSNLYSKSINEPQSEGKSLSRNSGSHLPKVDPFVADKDEVFALLPFLGTSQIVFINQDPVSDKGHRKIMLLYTIDLTWTGSVTSKVEIVASGISGKARRAAEDVFDKAMKTQDVVGAFKAVWDLLEMNHQSYEMPTMRAKGKRKHPQVS